MYFPVHTTDPTVSSGSQSPSLYVLPGGTSGVGQSTCEAKTQTLRTGDADALTRYLSNPVIRGLNNFHFPGVSLLRPKNLGDRGCLYITLNLT